MSKVLLVGKGYPDRGGIPTFLNTLRTGELGELHQITFLNVAHFGTPEGGEVTPGNIGRTLRDARNVFRMARGQDIVHIHTALAPAVTLLRAALLVLMARSRGDRARARREVPILAVRQVAARPGPLGAEAAWSRSGPRGRSCSRRWYRPSGCG